LAGVSLFRRVASHSIPRTELIAIDATVLTVTIVSIAGVMMLFGVLPALAASRTSLTATLTRIGRGGTATTATTRFRRVLLAGEVALSASLLIGAGLLLRTFTQLSAVDVGFETREVVRFSVVLPESDYPDLARAIQFYEALETRVAALPGVEAVGTMFGPPLGRGHATGVVLVEGRPARTREIGIRMALGAPRGTIVALVVRQGMQPAIVGLIIGVGVAFAGGRYLESVLYGVQSHDPVVSGVATTLMAGVALLAAAIPAIRASGIDPAGVLHGE
jgi:hypothetical protein